ELGESVQQEDRRSLGRAGLDDLQLDTGRADASGAQRQVGVGAAEGVESRVGRHPESLSEPTSAGPAARPGGQLRRTQRRQTSRSRSGDSLATISPTMRSMAPRSLPARRSAWRSSAATAQRLPLRTAMRTSGKTGSDGAFMFLRKALLRAAGIVTSGAAPEWWRGFSIS